jgi:thiamine pyrophosphokinase
MKSNDKHIIFANGVLGNAENLQREIAPGNKVVCADGGVVHAFQLGLRPDAVIGDVDSISNDTLERLRKENIEIVRYPEKKNFSDLELALEYSLGFNPKEILIACALGGRFDYIATHTFLLADSRLENIALSLFDGTTRVRILRPGVKLQIQGEAGALFSLLPFAGNAVGVTILGAEWNLDKDTLTFGKARGLSNRFLEETVEIQIESGLLLVVTEFQA